MLTRREFVKVAAVLGIALPATGCGSSDSAEPAQSGGDPSGDDRSVLIVGAGAAGMSAGHLLMQQGVDFRILEAAGTYGGRIKTTRDFVDFPIPLGGEWIHVPATVLDEIVNDESVAVDTGVAAYDPSDPAAVYGDGELVRGELGDYDDLKFVGETWLTFYEQFVVPGIESHMEFGVAIETIDSSSEMVQLTDTDGATHAADAVIVTVPPQIIKDGDVDFVPALSDDKREAFDEAQIWGGMKVFLEFSERFYPVFLAIAGSDTEAGQKAWYDAAYGQDSEANVLGLFTVGDQSEPYQARTGDDLRDFILAELDEIFDGAASRSYLQHVAQDWNAEPHIRQAYFADSGNWRLPRRMRQTHDERVVFAGASYTDGNDWGSVHTAADSARVAVERLLASW